jgi:hypothetical protein
MRRQPSRREFLKAAGLLAGTLPAAQGLGAIQAPSSETAVQAVRERLLNRRNKIETVHVDYVYSSTKESDLRNGRNQLFLSRGRLHVRNERKEGTTLQIVNGEMGLDAFIYPDGTVANARFWERSERRVAPRPLDSFLPMLEDKPAVARGFRQIDGDRCQGFLQGDRLLWVSTKTDVVRSVETYRTANEIEERILFRDFSELAPGLLFPRSMQVFLYDEKGNVVVERSITVNAVGLNESMDERLFSVQDFPAKDEKVPF